MEKGIDNKAKAEVERAFEKLGVKEQKELVKTLIWKTIAHEYIERKTDAFKNGKFTDYPNVKFAGDPNVEISEEDVQISRYNLVNKVADAVYPMVDAMFCDDDELKYRIFQKFITSYGRVEQEVRKQICGYHHDYSEWKTVVGERPVFNLDGEVSYHAEGTYYMRECKYCGEQQKAYSEGHKCEIEDETKYIGKLFPKKLIFTSDNRKEN